MIKERAAAISAPVREEKNLWVRIDLIGYQHDVFAALSSFAPCSASPHRARPTCGAAGLALATDAFGN